MSGEIAGFCPMGCGQTLFEGASGYITCSSLRCPRPTAVADLLDDSETEHVVVLKQSTFTVRHPLRERLDDELLSCSLDEWLVSRPGPPAIPGRYRVRWRGQPDATWEPLQ